MANEARHHHHIPRFYLRGFSVRSGKQRKITVGKLEEALFFTTNVRNVGGCVISIGSILKGSSRTRSNLS